MIKTLVLDDLLQEENGKEPRPILIVRLKTSCWHNENGIHQRKDLVYLKRKSKGFNIVDEDCQNIGANEVFPRITNIDECEDGIYRIETCNEFSSWETPPIIEDYDYKLVKYE